jgi:hypothetical protein
LLASYLGTKAPVEIVEGVDGLVEIAAVAKALDDLSPDPKLALATLEALILRFGIEGATVVLERDDVVVRREVKVA